VIREDKQFQGKQESNVFARPLPGVKSRNFR